MRIYSKKTYIVVKGDRETASVITGEQLRGYVADGSVSDGDWIYEAQLFATVKERREVILVEVEPVQDESSETTQ